MKKLFLVSALVFILIVGCTNKLSLQQYFVTHQELPNFVSVDVSPSILNLDKSKLSAEEATVLASFNKMNVLAFTVNDKSKARYEAEKNSVTTILKDTINYHQLLKFGSGAQGVSISFVGDEDHINEFVLFGNNKDNGFVVARILGQNMKPENAMLLYTILQKSKVNAKELEIFKTIMK